MSTTATIIITALALLAGFVAGRRRHPGDIEWASRTHPLTRPGGWQVWVDVEDGAGWGVLGGWTLPAREEAAEELAFWRDEFPHFAACPARILAVGWNPPEVAPAAAPPIDPDHLTGYQVHALDDDAGCWCQIDPRTFGDVTDALAVHAAAGRPGTDVRIVRLDPIHIPTTAEDNDR